MSDPASSAGSGPLHLTVVSPARQLCEGPVESIVVPGAAGEMGVLPGHADIVAALGTGVLKIRWRERPAEAADAYAVRSGFLEVNKKLVTVLVGDAVAPEEVDGDAVKEEMAAVLEELRHPESDARFAELLDGRDWGRARLKLIRPKGPLD